MIVWTCMMRFRATARVRRALSTAGGKTPVIDVQPSPEKKTSRPAFGARKQEGQADEKGVGLVLLVIEGVPVPVRVPVQLTVALAVCEGVAPGDCVFVGEPVPVREGVRLLVGAAVPLGVGKAQLPAGQVP